ncbi:MAG: DUF1080 domain-containing protein [Bacteroidetes bacterium]|nr:DUF1080 domain-containing protein [Bacteroidota bacterium]
MKVLICLITQLPILAFGQDTRPHVVFIAGEEEYGAHWTLPKIADDLQRRFNVRTTVIHSWRSGAHDYDMPGVVEIPEYEKIENLEIIKEADLVVIHIRFRLPPPEQLKIFQDYFDSGKPAIGFRTTSHGMWAADQKGWFVPFFGGHYKGHMPNTQGTTTIVPADQLDHPILRGVPKRNSMNDVMGIYVTAPLNDSTTPLMMGKTGLIGPAQPVTWINEYKKGQKIFYTSLGGLESFIDPGFLNMVYNAVYWALDREVPEYGVLGIDNLSYWEKEPPFERYAFGALVENPFDRPEEELEIENSKILDGDFVQPIIPSPPPSNIPTDATVLFDGKDLSRWRHWDLSADPVAMLPDARAVSPSPKFNGARWSVVDGTVEVRPGYGSVLTKDEYGNYRLHLDYLIPDEPNYVPEIYKGSGSIFLDGRYEVKILDSYGKEPSKVSNGSIFNQIAPSSNPSKPVNTWQSLDIEYRHYIGQRPSISVILNGEKIHNNVTVLSRSAFAIREDVALYISNEKDGSGIYNMNGDNWGAEIKFRTFNGGYLITNAPENKPWNDDSKGLMISRDGRLNYRNGSEYNRVQEEDATALNDGEWHNVVLSSDGGKVKVYIDGKYVNQIENSGSSTLEGHVLRIGQSTKRFRLGASNLPTTFRGDTFDGEISWVRFYKQALSESDISKLNGGEELSKKIVALNWNAQGSKKQEMKKGPIRLQSDLSKIRYANIWLQPLKE